MNIAIIFGILIIVTVGVYFLFRNSAKSMNENPYLTWDALKEFVKTDIDKSVSMTGLGIGLTLEEAEKQIRQREDNRYYIRQTTSGDRGARDAVKQMVKNRVYAKVGEKNCEKVLAFAPESVLPRTQFEAILYMYDSEHQTGTDIPEITDDGFANFMQKYGDSFDYELPTTLLDDAYTEIYTSLTFNDKINILTQILYADIFALGTIDTLNYQRIGIEEIQLGINGPQTRAYDYRAILRKDDSSKLCAKDSVEVLYGGKKIRLSFLSFATDAEMKRVIRNLVLNCNAGEITENRPCLVTETIDGRRVSISRPPMTDAWTAFIRVFGSATRVQLEAFYPDPIFVQTTKYLVHAGAHIGVTGEMESGKTTLLRCILATTYDSLSIGIIENDSFEVNGRFYFPTRNVTSFRITKDLNEEEAFPFIKKTSRQVLCVGEVNSLSMANLCNKVSKISTQVIWSGHYATTESMVSDFKNSKLCNGFSNERLAEEEAVNGINIDIHIVNKNGLRYIEYINEVVPQKDGYKVNQILRYNPDTRSYEIVHQPSLGLVTKAKKLMTSAEHTEMKAFFATNCINKDDGLTPEKRRLLEKSPSWVKQ